MSSKQAEKQKVRFHQTYGDPPELNSKFKSTPAKRRPRKDVAEQDEQPPPESD